MKNLTKSILLGGFAVLVASQLYAQPNGALSGEATTTTAGSAEPAPVILTPEEMKVDSQSLRDQVRKDIQRVQHLQALSRKEQDIIKLTCVNDKFVALKAEANIFDTAHQNLLGVLETSERFTAHTAVQKAALAVHKAREEADACVGNQQLGTDSSDYTRPVLLDDPTTGGLPFDIAVEPPAYASPFN